MTWIIKYYKDHSDTHYYAGLSSLCSTVTLHAPKPLSYRKPTNYNKSYCTECFKILKSKKMHQCITQRQNKLEKVQKKTVTEFRITLQDMLLNRLSHKYPIEPTKISELEELFSKEYPQIALDDVLVPLLVSGKITISGDFVITNPMEVSHVK